MPRKRSARASDFVPDDEVASHNEKIAKLPKGKDGKPKQVRATTTNSKGNKTSKKIVPSGKFSKYHTIINTVQMIPIATE